MRDYFSDIDWSRWSETIWTHGARVIITIVVAYLIVRFIQRLLGPAIRAAIASQMAGQPESEVQKRVETLQHVAFRTLSAAATMAVLLTILPEFGVNVGALLAGAGIAGIAIGLGAQSLVRDVISGLFILLENQYGKGDVVSIAGVGGLVEDVNLRRTLLRDQDGTLHAVPNGAIGVSSNLTRMWSRVNTVIRVSENEDLDRVFVAINSVGDGLTRDPAWSSSILAAPKALGVEGFSDSGIDIRIQGETQPNRQWDVTRELRLRLKKAFDAEGIRRSA
jgi:small conductance mechanosensitive channel